MSSDEEYDSMCEDVLSFSKKHQVPHQAAEQVCNLNELMPPKPAAHAPIYSRWSTCLFGGDDF